MYLFQKFNLKIMIQHWVHSKRFKEGLILGLFTFISIGLFIFRYYYTGSIVFGFLLWNLFLAFIPWALTSATLMIPKIRNVNGVVVALLVLWLLFFPNAPYILTDLFHLKNQTNMPIWYDLVLILSFAWTGLLYGMFSLWDLEYLVRGKISKLFSAIISTGLLFLCSFGIYLGRYLRWNSWDLWSQPGALMNDIIDRFLNPLDHPRTWGMTLVLGVFLNIVYWTFKYLREERYDHLPKVPVANFDRLRD